MVAGWTYSPVFSTQLQLYGDVSIIQQQTCGKCSILCLDAFYIPNTLVRFYVEEIPSLLTFGPKTLPSIWQLDGWLRVRIM